VTDPEEVDPDAPVALPHAAAIGGGSGVELFAGDEGRRGPAPAGRLAGRSVAFAAGSVARLPPDRV
jgi:hypothetical protein